MATAALSLTIAMAWSTLAQTDPLVAPGPPFPEPVDGVRIYDHVGVLSRTTSARAATVIREIEERTGAQVVIYTQAKLADAERTERDALALIDQWGVGRAGFDDGLAIFFNLIPGDTCHGQTQVYAAPGFASSYLTNEERQSIWQDDMLPWLRVCDYDGAVMAALGRIDTAATPENAARLEGARQFNAVLGFVIAPLLFVVLIIVVGVSWWRFGRDPNLLDDESILMPAPPAELTAALGAVIVDGRAKRRALTTALVDLASRGEINFKPHRSDPKKVDIQVTTPDENDPLIVRNRRARLGAGERFVKRELARFVYRDGLLKADDLPEFGQAIKDFGGVIERDATSAGWFRQPPHESIRTWRAIALVVGVAGVVAVVLGANLPSSGLLLTGVAAIAGGVVILLAAMTMPQRTKEGARVYAQLSAYKRTLQKTLEQSRTMDEVVDSHALPWVETPDQAVVWSYALGVEDEAERVLARSIEDARSDRVDKTHVYFPLWYGSNQSSGSGSAVAGGLLASSALPDFGSMSAALSSIGNTPSNSGGGGGFGGGGGGGGGGGAGGGH